MQVDPMVQHEQMPPLQKMLYSYLLQQLPLTCVGDRPVRVTVVGIQLDWSVMLISKHGRSKVYQGKPCTRSGVIRAERDRFVVYIVDGFINQKVTDHWEIPIAHPDALQQVLQRAISIIQDLTGRVGDGNRNDRKTKPTESADAAGTGSL